MKQFSFLLVLGLMLAGGVFSATPARAGMADLFKTDGPPARAIECPKAASPQERLAAREIRRYFYLRTGALLPVIESDEPAADLAGTIVVARKDRALLQAVASDASVAAAITALGPEQFLVRSIQHAGQPVLVIAGGDETGALYGAYRLAELMGVRFYLHGDVLPDEKITPVLPEVNEPGKPLFALRGIQPFHDFAEGPDWWSEDDYKAIIGQLARMRMNFIGLHTYPENGPHAEPTVWIGPESEIAPGGKVKASYPTNYFNTLRADNGFNWGYTSMKTGDFAFGGSQLFAQDAFGPEVMAGQFPSPKTPEGCNDVFNRTGEMLRGAFEEAHRLGVKTCVGTEAPLTIPSAVSARLSQKPDSVGPLGGITTAYKDAVIAGTDDSPVYNSCRYDLQGYTLAVPNGQYSVTLKFAELAYEQPGVRVFDVTLQGNKVIENLDIYTKAGKNKALDFTFDNIAVSDGKLRVGFGKVKEFPCISGLVITGDNFSQKMNCGGPAYKDYAADTGNSQMGEDGLRRVYTGIFKRIMAAYPIDYYWLWTSEGWTWQDVAPDAVKAVMNDFKVAGEAAKEVGAPFKLATCGWVLGPQNDRSLFDRELPKEMALSCINRQVGMAPVDTSFSRVKGRPLWAIPWLEDDPTLTSPQLWAGRMRRDAADALAYGCTGLMGIHWRTKILGPNVSALAQAGWDQSWSPLKTPIEGPIGGKTVSLPGQRIGNTADPELYRTMRVGLAGYRLRVPNGKYKVTLKFAELLGDGRDQRYLNVTMQDRTVMDADVYSQAGPSSAYDYTVKDVEVRDGWLDIQFRASKSETMISALAIEGEGFARRINCGGPAVKASDGEYEADPPALPRHLPVDDFYGDWATAQFGPEAGARAGAIFARIDGGLPLTAQWYDGPGLLMAEPRSWEQVSREFAFVDELAALRPEIKGAGERERFDYWLNTFENMRTAHHLRCVMYLYNRVMEKVKATPEAEAKKKIAREEALPLRREIVELFGQAYTRLLQTVSTPGELGTVANISMHSLPFVLTVPGKELETALGEPLPADAQPSPAYTGRARVIVPTVRGSLGTTEPLRVKVLVLGPTAPGDAAPGDAVPETATPGVTQPGEAALYWRVMGEGEFQPMPLTHVARGVYTVELPAGASRGKDLEYYVKVQSGAAQPLLWPATAPAQGQTVVMQ